MGDLFSYLIFGIVILFQIYSYFSGNSKRFPKLHTGGLIMGYSLIIPYILRMSPDWTSYSIQLFVTILILILDWFSFHEDKSRFSEEEMCLFGNCRNNARITGHLAHIADAASLGLIIVPFIPGFELKTTVIVGLISYTLVGMQVIEDYTKDGSFSDLRGLSEVEKCKRSRIMSDSWRGALNDIITVLGILLAWQSFFSCNSGACNSTYFPFNQVSKLWEDLSVPSESKLLFLVNVAKVLVLDIGLTIVPTFTNYVNTHAQHGSITSEEYGLPPCFSN
jgi:hypothetical protein|tara:strand:- start:82546 stop:83379 length:834 start_codon:yes stop_codon:yes gene_type:complete